MTTPMMLNICPLLGLCICSAPNCGFALRTAMIADHLVQKHKVPARHAREEEAKYAHLLRGKKITPEAQRYLESPVVAGEDPLPFLPMLPFTNRLLQCVICKLYCDGRQAYRTHLYKKHKGDAQLIDSVQNINSVSMCTGQSIFGGRKRLFFPVRMPAVVEGSNPHGKIDFGSANNNILGSLDHPSKAELDHRNSVALDDYSMNAWAEELKIANFLKESKLDCDSAFELSSNVSPVMKGNLLRLLLAYFDFFAMKNPRIPSPVVEMVRIRDRRSEASFDIFLPLKTKDRYARSVARVIITVLNLMKRDSPLSTVSLPELLRRSAASLRSTLNISPKKIEYCSLCILHQVLKELLLKPVKASEGETVSVENLCLVVLSGYANSSEGRARIGDAEDASHLSAALQFCCQMAAIGEFLVSPYGFGRRVINDSEEERRDKVEKLLCTRSATPAAFIRRTLYRTKHLSVSEIPRLSFIPCFDHEKGVCCGFLGALELKLNGPSKGKAIPLSGVLRGLQERAMRMLRVEIMKGFTIPPLFFEKALSMNDKMGCKDAGYWFGGTGEKDHTRSWADSFALHVASLSDPLLKRKGDGHWRHTEHADNWIKGCDLFVRILYCLIHICSGGPPRGTELGQAKIRNTASGRRNIFLYKRMVAFQISYTKRGKDQRPKPIARFVDPVTSRLLLMYMIIVKPVMAKVVQSTFGGEGGERDFLFARNGEVLKAHVLRDFFRKILHENDVPIGILDYRHYRTGIAKEFFSKDFDAPYGECGAFAQAGHSEQTAVANYAHIPGAFVELNATAAEAFLKCSKKWHALLELTEEWSIKLWNMVSSSPFKSANEPKSTFSRERSEGTQAFGELLPKNAGYNGQSDSACDFVPGKIVSDRKDIEKVDEKAESTPVNQQGKQDVTVEKKAFNNFPDREETLTDSHGLVQLMGNQEALQVDSNEPAYVDKKRTSTEMESLTFSADDNEVPVEKILGKTTGTDGQEVIGLSIRKHAIVNYQTNDTEKVKRCRMIDPESVLRLVFPSSATKPKFSCLEQRQALCETIMQGMTKNHRSCTLVVLPTGAGKTVTWAAPSLWEQNECLQRGLTFTISIVIVPLISLLQDMIRRAREYGLNAVGWDQRLSVGVSVVICSIDDVSTEGYKNFIFGMSRRNLLTRIVVDEAHTICLWQHYRRFAKISEWLRPDSVEVPLLLLTATAPSRLVPYIIESVGGSDHCFKLIRSITGRGNISYRVLNVDVADVPEMVTLVVQFLAHEMRSLTAKDRVMVYCLSRNEACTVRRELQRRIESSRLHLYHGHMPQNVRKRNLNSWINGDDRYCQALIGTTAIGCGLDYKSVRTVVHMGGSYTLLEFVQETGRAGRDGFPAKSVVFFNESYYTSVVKDKESRCTTAGIHHDHPKILGRDSFLCWVNDGRCRRVLLSEQMDGRARGRCAEGLEQLCDRCEMGSFECNEPRDAEGTEITPLHIGKGNFGDRCQDIYNEPVLGNTLRIIGSTSLASNRVFGPMNIDREVLFWRINQLASMGCAVCVFSQRKSRAIVDHKICMSGRCYRCMKYGAQHQSKECKAVPRSGECNKQRCFFCGLSRELMLHPRNTFGDHCCPWAFTKNLCLITWLSCKDRDWLEKKVLGLGNCSTEYSVCRALCISRDGGELPLMVQVVPHLYRRYFQGMRD